MKFFHLSDLHIGKQLHRYSLKEDQEAILKEIVSYAAELHPDAIVIAGDIYDKSVPSAEAVTVLDKFLTQLTKISPGIPILIISGNHDSPERLEYASGILKEQKIFLAGSAPEKEADAVSKVTLKDSYGEVDFYLLPFLKPSYVRGVFQEEAPQTYEEAVSQLIRREQIDFQGRRNVLVSHQFFVNQRKEGAEKEIPETCDSETFSVGGIDQVDIGCIREFDYAALGHLHGAQSIGMPYIRYCGTLLKYSVSEWRQEKTLTVVTLEEKERGARIELLPLHPLRDVKKKEGTLAEIIRQAKEEERGDYVSVTLTDETDPYRPKEQLEKVFDNILEIRVDNTRTRNKLQEVEEEVKIKSPLDNFGSFYQKMQGKEMSGEEWDILREILDEVKEE